VTATCPPHLKKMLSRYFVKCWIYSSYWRRIVFSSIMKPRPHQQQCRSNIVECYKSNDSFDKVECCFDIVAIFGNDVERNFVLTNWTCSICFDFIERTKITIQSFDIVVVFWQQSRIFLWQSRTSLRHCCLLLWKCCGCRQGLTDFLKVKRVFYETLSTNVALLDCLRCVGLYPIIFLNLLKKQRWTISRGWKTSSAMLLELAQ